MPESSKLVAQLMVPSSAVGFIRPGDQVQLRYQAFPHQKFGHYPGSVMQVSPSAIPDPAGGAGPPVYRVLVSLESQSVLAYGERETLRPGMLVDADILGERRRIIEWVFEPLYAIEGRLFN